MRARSALIVGSVTFLLAGGAGSDPVTSGSESRLPDWLTEGLLARDDALTRARALGVGSLAGKPLEAPTTHRVILRLDADVARARTSLAAGQVPGRASRGLRRRGFHKLRDSAIAEVPDLIERRPSVATRRGDPKTVVTAYLASSFPEAPSWRCLVKRSADRGRTWSEPVALGLLDESSICSDPVLSWTPGGRWLYAAYRNQRSSRTFLEAPPGGTRYRNELDIDILVARSRDGGRTWSEPVLALDGDASGVTITCLPGMPDVVQQVIWMPGFNFLDVSETKSQLVGTADMPQIIHVLVSAADSYKVLPHGTHACTVIARMQGVLFI